MKKSKLISILSNFNKNQMRQFEEFVASPYHNKRPELTKFIKYIRLYYPDFENVSFNKQNAFWYIQEKEDYDDKQMGYFMSFLLDLVENFLVVEDFKHQKIERKAILLRYYNDWGVKKAFRQTLEGSLKKLSSQPFRSADYYYHQFILNREEIIFFEGQKKHTYDQSLQAATDHLDIFFLTIKLKYYCEMVNRQKLLNHQYNMNALESILSYLDNHPQASQPPLIIYKTILLTLIEDEKAEHFYQLKYYLEELHYLFPKEETRKMYTYVVNYCIAKINSGDADFPAELFDVYRNQLRSELILENGFISPWAYMNIVSTAVRVEKFDWAKKFIHDYKIHLKTEFRRNAFSYTLAFLKFQLGEFEEAQKLLIQLDFNDIFYSIKAKVLLMKIYYELEEMSPLTSLSESFRLFLRRNRVLPKHRKKPYFDFISNITRLSKIANGDLKKLATLTTKINIPTTVNKKWLFEKIEQKK